MKRFALFAFAALAMAASAQQKPKVDWAKFDRYRAENRQVVDAGPDTCRIVMMGNSITQLWAERHPDFFVKHHMIGRGISGQTSYQMLSRFRRDVVELHPQKVIICAGTNDVAEVTHPFDPEITIGNIASMVEIARANGIIPIITTILPGAVWPWMNIADAPQRILRLNDLIRQYAADANVALVDYYPAMATESHGFVEGYTYDNIHPTPAGYQQMMKVLEENL